jgi:hypothetical protein
MARIASRALAGLALLGAAGTTGCTFGPRGAVGGGVYAGRGDLAAGAGGTFGTILNESDSLVVHLDVDVGARHVAFTAGDELNLTLGQRAHPLGLRLRAFAGGTWLNDTPGTLVSLGVVPGFWWMPFDTASSRHRVVFGVEPRPMLLVPVDGSPVALTPALVGALTVDWVTVPCTLFGGPTCDDPRPRP